MNRKNKIIAVGLVTAGLVGATWLSSEYTTARADEGQKVTWQERQERRIDHLKTALNLTPDQETKIRSVFEKQRKKMESLREETRKKLLAVLTPDQKQKFEA